jgi:hypothetical protein
LGGLAEAFLQRDDIQFQFARGWLDELRIGSLREDLATALARAPELRLLRSLSIAGFPSDAPPFDRAENVGTQVLANAVIYSDEEEAALDPLEGCPYLKNLRVLRFGDPRFGPCDVGDRLVPDLIAGMPRLETLDLFLYDLDTARVFALPTLSNLRELRVNGVYPFNLPVLAANPALGKLTRLELEASTVGGYRDLDADGVQAVLTAPTLSAVKHLMLRFASDGDALCRELSSTGVLRRLRTLDLQWCGITDEGAATLAGCPDLRGLESLDVSWNYLTKAGQSRLRPLGLKVVSSPQTQPPDDDADVGEPRVTLYLDENIL